VKSDFYAVSFLGTRPYLSALVLITYFPRTVVPSLDVMSLSLSRSALLMPFISSFRRADLFPLPISSTWGVGSPPSYPSRTVATPGLESRKILRSSRPGILCRSCHNHGNPIPTGILKPSDPYHRPAVSFADPVTDSDYQIRLNPSTISTLKFQSATCYFPLALAPLDKLLSVGPMDGTSTTSPI
jgi:hypothetical protein